MNDRKTTIMGIAACPHCHAALAWNLNDAFCETCGRRFPVACGVPRFVEWNIEKTADSDFQDDVMSNRSCAAKLYNWGRKFLSSEYMARDHVSEFLGGAAQGSIIVELGAGSRRLREDVINVDLFAFPHVDITADIAMLPFKDNSIDFIILDTVLEHVPEPQRIISEVHRTLRPAGKVISITPFIFPYHGYPKHYYNYTADGLDFLFRAFSQRSIETNMGPTSALVNLIAEYFAVAVSRGSKPLYILSKGAALLPIFFLKYLDMLWKPSGRGRRLANHLSIVATK